jgi:hypothetical protein
MYEIKKVLEPYGDEAMNNHLLGEFGKKAKIHLEFCAETLLTRDALDNIDDKVLQARHTEYLVNTVMKARDKDMPKFRLIFEDDIRGTMTFIDKAYAELNKIARR